MSNLHARFYDGYGRRAAYLRLSVTDRCNLRCFYCVSGKRQHYIPHDLILRYEEYLRLIGIAKNHGVEKLRITGGEPFARLDLMQFLFRLRSRFNDLRLAITTNATLIEPFIGELAKLDLASVNVSLDSFDRDTFQKITAGDYLEKVIANVHGLLSNGIRVKINAVALAGVSDTQLDDFIHFARNYPVDVRFIEYMPMGSNTLWDSGNFISCKDLQELVSQQVRLQPVHVADSLAGPGKMYAFQGAQGRIGFITAISDHFCAKCNRLRITSDGKLRTCLFSDTELKLAPLLRSPKVKDTNIGRVLTASLAKKPLGSDLLAVRSGPFVARRQMVGIGG